MAKAVMGFTITKPYLNTPALTTKPDLKSFSTSLRLYSSPKPFGGWQQYQGKRNSSKVNALPHFPIIDALHDWPLMAVLVEHMEGKGDFYTVKSIWHLSDRAIKNVYVFYIFFTCWGCLFFGSMKDPYYDSEEYRKDGGDGTGHWVYEKQENMEEAARAELWREELIEEIEQKVEGLRELEEAVPK